MLLLKQSTAVTVKIGPFLDEDDGKTAETGLTLSQADIRLTKNGGNAAQKNESSAATHDELGWYDCPLDATDTGTLGCLILFVHESGALPVWHEYMVIPANTYDSLVSGSDYLTVDAIQVEGSDATDQINSACDTAISDGALATAANLATVDTVVDAIKAVTDDWADAGRLDLLLDAIKAVTDNLPNSGALTDLATAANLTTVDTVVDAIKAVTDNLPNSGALTDLASAADLATVAGYIDTEIAAIKATTDKLDDTLEDDGGTYRFTENALEQAPSGSGGDATAANQTTIINALTAIRGADSDTLETLSDQIDGISTEAGAGAVEWTVTIQDENSDAVPNADVWVTSDAGGNNIIASGETDNDGQVTFYLDEGTVYVWTQKGGVNFTNPTSVTVTA